MIVRQGVDENQRLIRLYPLDQGQGLLADRTCPVDLTEALEDEGEDAAASRDSASNISDLPSTAQPSRSLYQGKGRSWASRTPTSVRP